MMTRPALPCVIFLFALTVLLVSPAWAVGLAPTADAGGDLTLCDTDGDGAVTVNLDGSASTDSDGSIVAYDWSVDGAPAASGATVSVDMAVGAHAVVLTVTDDEGLTDDDTIAVTIDPRPAVVQLDLSGGFNVDAIFGPREYQQCLLQGLGIGSIYGDLNDGVGMYIMAQSRHPVANGLSEEFAYSIEGGAGHPNILGGSTGLPADGVIVGEDRLYHLASTAGNATLPGDWTEATDPASGAHQPNSVVVGAYHNKADWQIASATLELPQDQKAGYGDINFILAAMSMGDRARNMRIVALYGDAGLEEEVLYAFSTDDGGSGPMMLDTDLEAGFLVARTMSKSFDAVAGTTGSLRDQASRLYEFELPLQLDPARTLWGLRFEDVAPGLNWNARGLVVFAATAKVPCAGFAPPVADAGADVTVTDVDNDGSESATLDASNSTDDGAIVSYEWTEAGAPVATGVNPAVTLAVGEHDLTLTVTDDDGLTDADTVTVSVLYGGVVADAGPDRNVVVAHAGDSSDVTLDASRSVTPMGVITGYVWREGGAQIATGVSPTVTLSYGSHTLELEVTNDLGWSAVDTAVVNLMTAPTLTGNEITNYKCGISLVPQGVPGVDWVFERWYHDPIVDDHGVIYINSTALLALMHNEQNRCANEDDPVIGADGLDGVPDSGDEGLIRMKTDLDWNYRYRWTFEKVDGDVAPENLVPAYAGPFSFADLSYFDGTPVVGTTGPSEPLDTYPPVRDADFYFAGLLDAAGDEWHILTVGDDDFMLYSTWYESWSSDGKIFYFVVDPKTPAVSFSKVAPDAQWYTTPVKAYFVPKLHEQTTYITPGVAFAMHNVTNGEPVLYRIDEIHGDNWLTFADAEVPFDGLGLASDTVYTLRYKLGSAGVERVRTIHYDPAYPSDAETHPSTVLFKNASVEQRIRDQIANDSRVTWLFDALHDTWLAGDTRPIMTGVRWSEERGDNKALNNAFAAYIDGFGTSPDSEEWARKYMLDNSMNLDPIGTEISHLTSVPCRERVGWGYYHVRVAINVALAYDLMIKEFRSPQYANGFTAIEDYKIRDMVGGFATETLRAYETAEEWPNRTGTSAPRMGMWTTAREMGIGLASMAIPTYDTPYFGTSGGDGRQATHGWTPYPDTPVTWFDAAMSEAHRAGIYGVLRAGDPVRWLDREGYWEGTGLMGQLYYKLANARFNYDGHRWPFFEEAFALSMQDNLQASKVQGGDDGWAHKTTCMIINEDFADLAEPMQAILEAGTGSTGEETIGDSLWAQGVFALCYMRLDWRDHVGGDDLPGDANRDGKVDLNDFVILKTNFGANDADWSRGDFDGDGDVDLNDFVILKTNFGATAG